MSNANFFDSDYYERGLQTGKSCYQNYIWMPELTIPLAMTIIDYLKIESNHTILDYGCSKGYLVKAFRMLHRQAWGVDISEYALSCVPEDIKQYCFMENGLLYVNIIFDYCVAKDVFEHMEISDLKRTLETLKANVLFAIIPLGRNGKYNAEMNNMDISHIICEDEIWWTDFFSSLHWDLLKFSFSVEGIKNSYVSIPEAHGFFVLKNMR